MLLHGLSGTQRHWEALATRISEHGEVITIDLPGFGQSPAPDEWTLDGVSDAIGEQLEAIGIDRFLLVGHSLGGTVGATLATRQPDRVAGLCLVSPAGFWSRRFASLASRRYQLAFEVWRHGLRFGASSAMKATPIRSLAFSLMVHRPLESLQPGEAEALVAGAAQGRSTMAAREAAIQADLFDVARELRQPVELIWGREDRITTFDSAARVARTIPDVRTHFIDDVGHLVMYEDRDVIVNAVASLVERTRGRSSRLKRAAG